jgi:hypothetical protein
MSMFRMPRTSPRPSLLQPTPSVSASLSTSLSSTTRSSTHPTAPATSPSKRSTTPSPSSTASVRSRTATAPLSCNSSATTSPSGLRRTVVSLMPPQARLPRPKTSQRRRTSQQRAPTKLQLLRLRKSSRLLLELYGVGRISSEANHECNGGEEWRSRMDVHGLNCLFIE